MKKLLVMLLCLGLVGCQFGGSETEKPEEPNTENPTPEVEEPEVEEPEVEEPEVEEPEVEEPEVEEPEVEEPEVEEPEVEEPEVEEPEVEEPEVEEPEVEEPEVEEPEVEEPEVEEPEVEEPEVEEPEVEAPYVAPAFYKYYFNPDISVEENIAVSLERANLPATAVTPIIVDEVYNTVVLVNVKSPVTQIGSFAFDVDKLAGVGYSVEEYVKQYSNEAVVQVEQTQSQLLALLCLESEGIPHTALWYKDEAGNLKIIELVPGGIDNNEGLVK